MANKHLERAVEFLGSQGAVGVACGRTQQNVSYWMKKGCDVPPEYAPEIVKAIKRKAEEQGITPPKVTREGLSPNFPWGDVA